MNDIAGLKIEDIKILNEPTTEKISTIKDSEVENPNNVFYFRCKKDFWKTTATMIGAPNKCMQCGSKLYLEYALAVTKSRKVKDADLVWRKFLPNSNKYSNIEPDIKEETSIFNQIDNLLPSKIKEVNQMEEKENEVFIVRCPNQSKCQSAIYETNDPTLEYVQKCRACLRQNNITLKK